MKTKVICNYCGKETLKEKRNADRNIKNGKPIYCSRSCAANVRSNKTRLNPIEVAQYFKDKDCELLGEYKNIDIPVPYRCSCGNISKIKFGHFKNGSRCMKCSGNEKHSELSREETLKARHFPEYVKWRKTVYKRDSWTCKRCSKRGGILNVHHIRNYSSYPEGRLDPNNGIVFCKNCHNGFHSKYGKCNNNEQQLAEYLISA